MARSTECSLLFRILYNDVATEAQFSTDGARQFSTDVDAIVAVFRPYTPRPGSHFRELREACTLLLLDEESLAEVEDLLLDATEGKTSSVEEARAKLNALGVLNLSIEQAESVLAQRV
eukprot:scaffold115746_cov25-Prasinocladus_malaysianus.AAC.2